MQSETDSPEQNSKSPSATIVGCATAGFVAQQRSVPIRMLKSDLMVFRFHVAFSMSANGCGHGPYFFNISISALLIYKVSLPTF